MKNRKMQCRALLVLACLAAGALRAQDTNTVQPAPPAPADAAPTASVTTTALKTKTPGASFLAGGSSTNHGGMVITSERLEFDYKEFVVAFDENVHVTDPQFTLTSDRLLVFLEGTNQIKRIVAIGHVDVVQVDRHATCDKAVYERGSGQVVMTGNPVMSRGSDRVAGREITIWLNDERVVVQGGRMTISPESMKNRDIKP